MLARVVDVEFFIYLRSLMREYVPEGDVFVLVLEGEDLGVGWEGYGLDGY